MTSQKPLFIQLDSRLPAVYCPSWKRKAGQCLCGKPVAIISTLNRYSATGEQYTVWAVCFHFLLFIQIHLQCLFIYYKGFLALYLHWLYLDWLCLDNKSQSLKESILNMETKRNFCILECYKTEHVLHTFEDNKHAWIFVFANTLIKQWKGFIKIF